MKAAASFEFAVPLLLHFYPGLTMEAIEGLTLWQFHNLLSQVGPILRLFSGEDSTSAPNVNWSLIKMAQGLSRTKGILK